MVRAILKSNNSNFAVPMGKRSLTVEEQQSQKKWYPRLYELREKCFGGFLFTFSERNTFEDSPEEREEFWHKLWDHGGFSYWLGNYKDYLYDPKANRAVIFPNILAGACLC